MRKEQWPTVIACYVMVIWWVFCLAYSTLLGVVLWGMCTAIIGLAFKANDYWSRGLTLFWPLALAFHALGCTFFPGYRKWAFERTSKLQDTTRK